MTAEKMNPEKRCSAFEALVEVNSGKERALALLREQQCERLEEKAKLRVIQKLVESEGAFDLVGAVIDEFGELIFYIIDKSALLSEFGGSIFARVCVRRACAVNGSFSLYMAHQAKRIGILGHEQRELALERIINALLAGKDEGFGDNFEQ